MINRLPRYWWRSLEDVAPSWSWCNYRKVLAAATVTIRNPNRTLKAGKFTSLQIVREKAKTRQLWYYIDWVQVLCAYVCVCSCKLQFTLCNNAGLRFWNLPDNFISARSFQMCSILYNVLQYFVKQKNNI